MRSWMKRRKGGKGVWVELQIGPEGQPIMNYEEFTTKNVNSAMRWLDAWDAYRVVRGRLPIGDLDTTEVSSEEKPQ